MDSPYHTIPCLSHNSEKELSNLLDEENVFGFTPKEIGFSKCCNRVFENSEKKLFNYNNFARTCVEDAKLRLLDGQLVDLRILYATRNELLKNCSYDEFKDINYRDENGKHLVHYLSNCLTGFSSSFQSKINSTIVETVREGLGLSLKDIVYCKDINETMPIQKCYLPYFSILKELAPLGLLNINFFSYSDDFGMYRFMYLLLSYSNLDIIFNELHTIAFDYSQKKPQLISLCCESDNEFFYFSLEQSDLTQLTNVSYLGSCDGDDFSHWIIRYCLFIIENDYYYYNSLLDSLLHSLIKKGLRFDVVRNCIGKTAFDILNEYSCNKTVENFESIKELKDICRKGLQNNSKALPHFILKYNKSQKHSIVEESETKIISTDCPRVKVVRAFYFPKQ